MLSCMLMHMVMMQVVPCLQDQVLRGLRNLRQHQLRRALRTMRMHKHHADSSGPRVCLYFVLCSNMLCSDAVKALKTELPRNPRPVTTRSRRDAANRAGVWPVIVSTRARRRRSPPPPRPFSSSHEFMASDRILDESEARASEWFTALAKSEP